MSKNITTFAPPKVGSAGSLLSILPVGSDDQATAAIQREMNMRAENPAYGLGVALRKLWDFVSLKNFGLPMAEAAPIPISAKLDDEFEARLESVEFEFDVDERMSKKAQSEGAKKKMTAIVRNVKNEFRKAASEGPKTKDLVSECLADAKIIILDKEYSAERIVWWQERLGTKSFGGAFDPRTNRLALTSNFAGKYTLGTIVHECGHVREFLHGVTYDEALLDKCVTNLQKLGVAMIECLDGVKKIGCEEIKKQAAEWGSRKALELRDNFAADVVDENGGMLGVLTIDDKQREEDRFPKLKRTAAVVRVICDGEKDPETSFCVQELDSTQNIKSGIRTTATKDQAAIFAAATDVTGIIPSKRIKKLYPTHRHPEERHATIVDHVPERVLDAVCPDGFVRKASANKASGGKKRGKKSGGGQEL
jgi:hypothetical protein